MSHLSRTSHVLVVCCLLLAWPASGIAGKSSGTTDLPLPVRVVLNKVYPLLEKKEYPGAVARLRAFQARGGPVPAPDSPDPRGYHHSVIYYTLGNCYLLQEQYQSAAEAYRQAVARDPGHAFAWLNLAKSCYELKDYVAAGDCFGQAYAATQDKQPQHLYFSAAAYLMAANYRQSIAVFEELLAAHPQACKPQWKEHLVHALLSDKQPRRALPYIRELASVFTGDKQVQWQEILLYQYLQLGMQSEALSLARELTDRRPAMPKWWKALSHIQLNAGHNTDALAALTIYAYLTPLTLQENKLLADLSLQAGIPVKAVPVYEACLKEKAEQESLRRLITAYRQLGRADLALKCMRDHCPQTTDAALMMLKAELLYALKRYKEAAASFRHVAKRPGTQAGHAWLMAGYAAWQIKDLVASKADFARAAEYKKEKKLALAALRQIEPAVVK